METGLDQNMAHNKNVSKQLPGFLTVKLEIALGYPMIRGFFFIKKLFCLSNMFIVEMNVTFINILDPTGAPSQYQFRPPPYLIFPIVYILVC